MCVVWAPPASVVSCGQNRRDLGAHILLLQETYFRQDAVPSLPTPLYSQWFLSNSPRVKSCGVAIATHNNCPFVPVDHYADPYGRFLFLEGTLYDRTLTLATVYAPNTGQLTFLDSMLESLSSFREGQLILMRARTVIWIPPLVTRSTLS